MIQIIQIILESINSLLKGLDIFLQSKDLTVGAILALVAPFVVIWMKISNEKGKKAKQLLIERRQMQIAFNLNEIMEAMKVESKWSIQEIESTHTVLPSLKRFVLLSQAVTILRRKKVMEKLKSRKLWLALLGAIIPVLNVELGLDLDAGTIWTIVASIIAGIAGLAHVDAKRVAKDNVVTKIDDGPAV